MSLDMNFSSNTTFQARLPLKRVFIEDIDQGQWDVAEKMLSSRYGPIKRARICGILYNKREIVEEGTEEDFLAESVSTKSRIEFYIDDGTGRLKGTVWGAAPEDYFHLKKGDTVDVIGLLREPYRNLPQMIVEIIRSVKNPNFESYHMVEVIRKRKLDPNFEITKTSSPKVEEFDFDSFEEDFAEINNFDNIPKASQVPAQNSTPTAPAPASNFASDDLSDQIVEFIQQKDQGDGVSVDAMLGQFSISKEDLLDMLENLCQDIRIYKVKPNYYQSY